MRVISQLPPRSAVIKDTDAGTALPTRLDRAADKVERAAPVIAGALVIFILLPAIVKGLYKPLWFDELYTTFVSRFHQTSDFWSFARTGADGQPPFYYYFAKAGVYLARNEPLGVRLPSILGYLVFCSSLYVFVSRIATKTYGLAALLLPGITGCWYYLTEARPYGLVLGCTGLAAISWQSVALGQRRKPALVGLAVALAGAFAVHFFSVLLLAPFGAVELVRAARRRKPDTAAWIALCAPLLVFAATVPVALEAGANGGVRSYFSARPDVTGALQGFVIEFLAPCAGPLMAIACLYLGIETFAGSAGADTGEETKAAMHRFAPETVFLLSLTSLPVLALLMGKFVSHSFYARYAIAAMFGMTALIVLIAWRAMPRQKIAGLLVAGVFAGVFAYRIASDLRKAQEERTHPVRERMLRRIPRIARQDQLPIAIGDRFPFMELSYYGDPELVRRICYLASPELDVQYNGANNGELGLIRSAGYFGTHVVDYRSWTRAHHVFYLLGGTRFAIPQLIKEGARLQLLQGGPEDQSGKEVDLFFRVTMPG